MSVYKEILFNKLIKYKYICIYCGFRTNEIAELRRHKSICKYYETKTKRDFFINDHLVLKPKRKYVKKISKQTRK
jgi:C4-type Zn-finger protein